MCVYTWGDTLCTGTWLLALRTLQITNLSNVPSLPACAAGQAVQATGPGGAFASTPVSTVPLELGKKRATQLDEGEPVLVAS